MEQKTAFTIKRKRVTDSREKGKKIEKKTENNIEKYPDLLQIIEEKMKTEKQKRTAKILEKYPGILQKIKEKMKTEKLHPWVKEFAGIISIEKNED